MCHTTPPNRGCDGIFIANSTVCPQHMEYFVGFKNTSLIYYHWTSAANKMNDFILGPKKQYTFCQDQNAAEKRTANIFIITWTGYSERSSESVVGENARQTNNVAHWETSVQRHSLDALKIHNYYSYYKNVLRITCKNTQHKFYAAISICYIVGL